MSSNSANDTQVGGRHYKGVAVQHWDMVAANGLGYFEGQVSKYVTRWRKKNGLEDLKKARHFLTKLIELNQTYGYVGNQLPGSSALPVVSMSFYSETNGLDINESAVCWAMRSWDGELDVLKQASGYLDKLISEAEAAEPGAGYVNQG